MDIYILRDGKEIGPFSEATTQTLLKQGSIAEADYAWHPGLPKWIPLTDVLRPAAPALETPPPPPPTEELDTPLAAPAPAANLPKAGESATEKQKALLAYLGIPFSSELSKDQAALLVNDAMEDAKNGARLTQWNTDRLKLHPDLFAAEIQAKKESRASEYFDVCESEGAEYFTKITKAHCQVLVGYLDVKFPNWDEDKDAAKKYFFPAVAEKFPQLVAKPWKGKLRYSTGPKISAEMNRQRPATGKLRKRGKASALPLAAIGRGLVFGGLILGMFFFVQKVLKSGGSKSTAPATVSQAGTPVPSLPAPLPAAANPEALPPIEPEKAVAAAPVLPADPLMADPANPAAAAPVDPKMAVAALPGFPPDPLMAADPAAPKPAAAPGFPPDPLMAADPLAPKPAAAPAGFPPDPPMAADPAAPKPAAPAGFPPDPLMATDPTAPANPAVAPAPAPTAPAAVPADPGIVAKVNLKLTRPIEVQLAYGKMKLPVGTPVKLVAREGNAIRVNYLNTILVVPITSTDFAEAAPPPASVPAAPPSADL